MNKRKIVWFIKLVIGFILLYLIYQQVNQRDAVIFALKSAQWSNVLLCILFLVPNFLLQFLKWRLVLGSRIPDISTTAVYQSLLFGVTLGFVTPGNLGDLARALSLKKYDRTLVTGLNIIDKFSGTLIFYTTGIFSIIYIMVFEIELSPLVIYPLVTLCLIFLVLIWFLVLNPLWMQNWTRRLNQRRQSKFSVERLLSSLDGLTRIRMFQIVLVALGWFVILVIQYHLLITAFHDVSFFHSCIAVSAILFTKILLPISLADLGVREVASIYYYSLFGVARVAAFNAALLIFMINIMLPALVGSYFVFKLHWINKNS